MRAAGRLVAECFAILEENVKPGVTLKHLDQLVENHIYKQGAETLYKGYQGRNRDHPPFPGVICASVNHEICHGLPDGRVIVRDLDLVIAKGERVMIMGPPGAGKSTLFRAFAGLWPFGSGRIHVPAGARVLFLPQKPYLPVARLIDAVTYPLVPDLPTLTYLVNLNSLEFHVPQWTVDDDGERQNPNRLVIDLDPGKPADLHECCQVALHLRERLGGLGLELFPVTSGSKGMQLYASLGGDLTSDQVRDLAQQLAQEMTAKHPDLVLWKMTKSLRPGKIFLDWSQNVAAKTTISPYSLRGRDLPCVAAPRTWAEVEAGAADRGAVEQVMLEDMLDRLGPGGIDEGGRLLADLL